MKVLLSPIHVERPPKHTKVVPRCLTCSKFEICRLRCDYLKAALLIEQILGNPQQDYELTCCRAKEIIENGEEIFPATISYQNENMEEPASLSFDMAISKSPDTITLFYRNNEDAIISIHAKYSEDTYQIEDGHDIHLQENIYIILDSTKESLIAAALAWRNSQQTPEDDGLDVINTTYFSAILNCDFYEQDKTLTPELGAKRMFCNCEVEDYHHLATFHKFAPIPLPPKTVCRRKNVKE